MVKRNKLIAISAWITTAALLSVSHWAEQAGYRFNTTVSMPSGLYQIHPRASMPLMRGSLVIWCPPNTATFRLAKARHYIGQGSCPGNFQPLLKPVAAISGDTVELSSRGIQVNGHLLPRSQPLAVDTAGRQVNTYFHGVYTVKPGEIWLISSHSAHSFDSRYFGPVLQQQIQYTATAILTGD
jgi:conjugative transfer signal peptidase TraF